MYSDILIIGAGIAGLNLAIELCNKDPSAKITLVAKSTLKECNTNYAQGGIAAVLNRNESAIQKHINDTLAAGDGLCKLEVVEFVVRNAKESIESLISLGVDFNKTSKGTFHMAREGGHNQNIILHDHDSTGSSVQSQLLNKVKSLPQIKVLENCFCIDLLISDNSHRCLGATVFLKADHTTVNLYSKTTVLATGGLGQVYDKTTNPAVSTGDGIAMAYRAGAVISNMEFFQFHPTALYEKNVEQLFLISEAIRGGGAKLVNEYGERFMEHYHSQKELACRDVVSRAVNNEISKSRSPYVWLDCRGITSFSVKFPKIFSACLKIGVNPEKDLIPVLPAAHYQCGGIETNLNGETNIDRLYAIGECANTGFHGANRLASNSLLEALVFSRQISHHIINKLSEVKWNQTLPELKQDLATHPFNATLEKPLYPYLYKLKRKLQKSMSAHVGVIRSTGSLKTAKKDIEKIYCELKDRALPEYTNIELCELHNLLICAQLIINQSLDRKQNAGGYYRINFAS